MEEDLKARVQELEREVEELKAREENRRTHKDMVRLGREYWEP